MTRLLMTVLLLVLAATMGAARAEPISTTSCKAAADRTKTQNGKTYNCTGCEACTTTTCQTGGTLNCTNTTTTTCSCTEASAPKAPKAGAATVPGTNQGVLDPARPATKVPRTNMPAAGGVLRKQ